MRGFAMKTLLVVMLAGMLGCATGPAAGVEFPPETNYDTSVGPDEALANLRIRNHRWPDCYSLETCVRDIFRLEGADDTPDATAAKAMALWKWLHMLKSTGGSRVFEGNPYGRRRRFTGDPRTDQIEIRRGDKQLLVYGLHECGGMSRTMAGLWRAAGYVGYQEPSSGHSTAALRWPDKDGVWRMHSFNPQGHSYYWNPRDNRVGTRRLPVMRGVEYRRLPPPMTHTLRTSLRVGERVVRKWSNDGYIQKTQRMLRWAGEVGDNRRHLAAGVAGQEDQTFDVPTDPKTFEGSLWTGSTNAACSAAEKGRAVLHPERAGEPSRFIYRLASPYVAVEAVVEAELVKTAPGDLCRLSFSTDGGKTWHTFHDQKEPGVERVTAKLGQDRYWGKQPSITSYYNFLVRAEFRTDGRPGGVGMNALKVVVHRQLNMRCLPNLMPKENVIKVSADSMRPGLALRLQLDYEVNGKPKSVTRAIAEFPHYLRIDVTGLPKEKLKNPYYLDKLGGKRSFNLPDHPLRMRALRVELVPLAAVKPDASLPADEAEPFFERAYPNPYIRDRRMIRKEKIPTHEDQVDGFFPQHPVDADNPPKEKVAYYNWFIKRIWTSDARLPECPEGTDPIEFAIGRFPRCHSLHTLGFCNVFAHYKDKRAIPVLLAKWKKAPRYSPGDRYIPDALAAIGDRSVVPALVERLTELRFSHRVHVAHALGILGGGKARKALEFLAENDPNISVRGEARRALKKLADKEEKE
ncbi:MAG: HEAT repeat domain-containing protein [Planctomycetota bacterium]